ncbi:MAG: hypothetical protein ABIK97_02210 [candidate division WOR-3 bacterium]
MKISIYRYKKKEEGDVVTIREEKREEKSIEETELNKEIEALSFTSFDYASIFIEEELDISKIEDIEKATKLGEIGIGKIKGKDIFIFSGKDEGLLEYIERRCYELIEIGLYAAKFDEVIKDYKEIFDKGSEKSLRKLMDKNRFYLPLLKELERRLAVIKEEMVNREDNISGLFHHLLQEVKEENIITLSTWIDISSNYLAQKLQMKTNKLLLWFTIIIAIFTFLTLLPSLIKILNLLK